MAGPLHMYCALCEISEVFQAGWSQRQASETQGSIPTANFGVNACSLLQPFLLLTARTPGAQVQDPVLSGTSMSHGDKTHFQMNFKRRI